MSAVAPRCGARFGGVFLGLVSGVILTNVFYWHKFKHFNIDPNNPAQWKGYPGHPFSCFNRVDPMNKQLANEAQGQPKSP